MECSSVSCCSSPATLSRNSKLHAVSSKEGHYKANLMIIQATFNIGNDAASNETNFQDLYKSLSITQKNIVDKINELIKTKVPGGVQSLSPSEVTPEATADRIVQGSTAFFQAYSKQHPELEGEDLLNSFMEQVRSGIQKGYDDAFDTLKGLGAFDVDGVQAGVEKTKELIETRLQAFESYMRKQLGIDPVDVQQESADAASHEIMKQGGANLLDKTVQVRA